MSLRKFVTVLSEMAYIRPVKRVSFQGEGPFWQIEISFATNNVSDIFTITLYGTHVRHTSGRFVLNMKTDRVSAPRTDNVHPLHLAAILNLIGNCPRTLVLPSKETSVRDALQVVGISMYTWRGTVWGSL